MKNLNNKTRVKLYSIVFKTYFLMNKNNNSLKKTNNSNNKMKYYSLT